MSMSTRSKRQSTANKPSSNVKRTRASRPTARPDEWVKLTNCSILRLGNTSATACPPLSLPADMSTAALDSDTSLLSASLYPLPVAEFKKEYWRKKAVAILGAGSRRVEQLIAEELCGLDVKELMAASASEQIFVWMKERHAATDTLSLLASSASSSSSSHSDLAKQPITSFPLDNPNQLDAAMACYNSGSSLYFRSPPPLAHRFVRAFNAGVGFNWAGLDYSSTSSSSQAKGEIEVFVSRAGHHTGWHFDFMDNFTVQLRGKKTWMFGGVDTQYPVRGFTPHYKDRSTDELQYKVHSACQEQPYDGEVPESGDDVTLSAGDVLYHPAGIWHAVTCDEDSVSINISLIATTAADVISDAVRQMLWTADDGRAGLCGTHYEMQTQLDKAMKFLKEYMLCDLTSAAMLPATIMAPRRRQPVNIDAEVDKRLLRQGEGRGCKLSDVFKTSHRYKFNPLMTITPYRGRGEEEEEEEEGEAEVEAEEEAEEKLADIEEEKKERDDSMVDSDNSNSASYAQYVLHHLFGNESVDSAMRIILRVHHSLQPVFDIIVTHRNNPEEDSDGYNVWQRLVPPDEDEGDDVTVDTSSYALDVARCLFVLREVGFVTAVVIDPPRYHHPFFLH